MAYSPTKPRDYGSTKALVARLIDEAGGAKQAAFIVGRAASQVYAYADPDVDSQISLDMARRLAFATGSAALAEDFAALAGGVFMKIASSDDDISQLAATSAQEHGRVTTQLFVALADQRITPEEARELLSSVDDQLRALVAMRARFAFISGGKV